MKAAQIGVACLALILFAAAAVQKSKNAGDVERGKAVFEQCAMCHSTTSTEKGIGPGLKGLFKRQKLANGKKVTEANVMEQIDEGGAGMPAYADMLSPEEKRNLLAYLKTL
ncbi:MAG TPA: cytochrome c [Bryobacteraceae bacterium]|nr:cytochrome c [Bryobacteraceae bacterium]HPQ16887.1 cytochrome c [Bryobacteraceae bacterium]HPU73579.1 cytochrome c [Bryobacteraceae bacterium]